MDTQTLLPTYTTAPAFELNPSGKAPLSGVVSFVTAAPSLAEITLDDGAEKRRLPTSGKFAKSHEIPVLGLKPARAYTLRVTARNAAGNLIGEEHAFGFTTEALPADLPGIELRKADRARMAPGLTLMGIRRSARLGAKTYGYLVAVDEAGEVVWLRETGHVIGDVKRLRNGNIVYLTFDNRAIEIDMLGYEVNSWYAARRWPEVHDGTDAIPVDAEAFHHEIFEMENGNFLVLSVETRDLENYPTCETDLAAPRGDATVVGDVAVEFRRDGTVVDSWHLFDILDPYRIGYGTISEYWARKGILNSRDWTHTNSLIHDPSDDSLILSMRHQDAVIKIDRKTKTLKWILGTPDGWSEKWADKLLRPAGALDWPYHTHNATVTPAGTLLLFDNGNHRAVPGQAPLAPAENYSRAVEFDVDTEAGTVAQVWQTRRPGPGEPPNYAPFISGAQWLDGAGTVLVCFGGMLSDDQGNVVEDTQDGLGWVRIVEVTRDDDAEPVFELVIDERGNGLGWDVYRATRIADLLG
jgi:hypothetical protein